MKIMKKKKQQQEDLDGSFIMEELVRAVNYTKEKLAPRRDNIEYRMLKELSDKFMKELLVIFNWCYKRGNQIEEWQEHRTIFIDKGDKEKVRLITLASRVMKVLERIINKRLIWWPEKSEKYEQSQNGFRRGKSCIENIVRLVEIEIAKRENKYTIAAYLNVSSAYDNVRRELLMQKLIKKECPRKIVRYVNSWMKERRSMFVVADEKTIYRIIHKGLLQGSIISPILYAIYTKEITEEKREDCTILQYADDVAVHSTGEDPKVVIRKVEEVVRKIGGNL